MKKGIVTFERRAMRSSYIVVMTILDGNQRWSIKFSPDDTIILDLVKLLCGGPCQNCLAIPCELPE